MRLGKRVTGLLLAACLAVGMAPTMAFAEDTNKTIMLGTSGIENPTSSDSGWSGSYVYFGSYDSDENGTKEPVKYRVLAKETTDFSEEKEGSKAKTMLLDCDVVLKKRVFDSSSNIWASSDIKKYLNSKGDYSTTGFLTTSFSKIEQAAIAESTTSESDEKTEGYLNYVNLTNEKIFILDAKEATNTSYGYSNDNNRKKTGGNAYWWLRSPCTTLDNYAGRVLSDGDIFISCVDYEDVGVSPALNIDLSSVLFSSKADDASKTSVLSNSSSKIAETQVTEWKLTLKDSGKSVSITDGNSVTRKSDGTIMVPYTYSDNSTSSNETVNQISVMITDLAYDADNAKILYYGKLDTTLSTSGEGSFILPEELKDQTLGSSYHLYILAEHVAVSGESKTDYASAPVEITSITDVSDAPVIPDTDDSNNSSSNTDTVSTETTTTEPVEPTPITITYTVKKDDYMRKIAREHGITLEQLIALNPQVKNPNLIYAGQVLVISTTGSTTATTEITTTKTYTVQRGDSLYKIARQNSMTLAELKSLNENIFAQKYIYAGQQVLLK